MRRAATAEMHRGVSILVLIGAVAGCITAGPDYRRPVVDAPERFRFEDSAAQDVANTAWWQQFGDPVLDELIRSALADNRDVKIAAARIEEFLGRYGVTRSQFFPQVSADVNVARQRVSRAPLPSPVPSFVDTEFTSYQATLLASWELDVWGRIRRLSEAARADVLASEEGRRATILTLVSSVASSYINLRDLDRRLVIARYTTKSRENTLRVFERRFAGGIITQMELAQSRSEYESTAAQIPQIEALIAQQENSLSVLLGHNPGAIARGLELDALAIPPVPAGLPSELLERRPDLRQAEQNLIAANATIGAARALYFPVISLTGVFGGVSAQLSKLFSGPSRVWSFAGDAIAPIFTAGAIEGQVKQAEARQQQALHQYQKAIQTAFREVEDALVLLQKSREQLLAQGRQLDALRTYARLARLRYEGGYSSYIEVLDAERSLFSGELSYTQTQAVALSALVDLYKSLGGGWVDVAGKLALPPESIAVEPARR